MCLLANSEDIGDTRVLASQTGAHWRVITDEGVIDRFAVDGATLYGRRIREPTAWRRMANGSRFRRGFQVRCSRLSLTETDCMWRPSGAGCSTYRLRKRGMPCLIDRRDFFAEKSFFIFFTFCTKSTQNCSLYN